MMMVTELSRVWVISRSVGEWSDRSETPVGFVTDEEMAKLLTERAMQEWRSARVLHPDIEYPEDSKPLLEMTDEELERSNAEFKDAQERHEQALRALLTVDPDAAADCDYDDPHYFYSEVHLLASAGDQ